MITKREVKTIVTPLLTRTSLYKDLRKIFKNKNRGKKQSQQNK